MYKNFLTCFISIILLSITLNLFSASIDKPQKSKKINVLLFHGGRPWTGKNAANMLKQPEFNVRLVDSRGLDGLGGAPIRKSLKSKIEPKPEDWITPEFKKLSEYNVVIVCCIPKELQKKFYTPERLKALKLYVEHGGTLIVTENTPHKLMEPFLPVVFSPDNSFKREGSIFCKNDSKAFSTLPEKWPCFTLNKYKISLKPTAEALIWEVDKTGQNIMPYIAVWQLGKGKVIYNNFDWGRKNWFRQMFNWAYFKDFLSELTSYAGNVKIDKTAQKADMARKNLSPEKISNLSLALKSPSFSETKDFKPPQILENNDILWIKFSNGSLIEFNKSKLSYNGFVPGVERAVYHNCLPPEFLKSTEQQKTFKDSEFSTAGEVVKSSSFKPNYTFSNVEKIDNGGVVIKLKDKSGLATLDWIFSPKNMNVMDRSYKGFGEKVKINAPNQIFTSAVFSNQVRMGESINDHVSCRFYAYSSPRGYLRTEFSEDRKSITGRGSFFSSGQPFNWLFSKQGIICEFFESPFSNISCLYHEKGQKNIEIRNIIKFGRVRTPLETPFIWRLFSPDRPVGVNSWIAMYQYLRLRFCRQAGIDPVMTMPKPGTSFSNTCTESEIRKSFAAAKKLGFDRIWLPLCPSEIEEMLSERVTKLCDLGKEYEVDVEIWTPASHVRDIEGTTAEHHPEWLVYDKDDKPYAYGGQFKVYDLNNKECFENYLGILDKGIQKGIKHIWFDMGAALMDLPVNYKTDTSKVMLDRVIEIYKYLNKKGVSIRIEGISPFAVDGFWFRESKYPNHAGKEFAFVGTGCYRDMKDNLALDYFKLAMNNAFFDFSVSPYACGMENVPGEMKVAEEIGKLNPVFLKAMDAVGHVPFVQQTNFGTSWTGDKGAALFFWNPVEKLFLTLPDNWKIQETFSLYGSKIDVENGNIVKNVPSKSIIIISK